MPIVEEKVDRLEEVLQEFIVNVNKSQSQTEEFKDEMKEFKDEMKEFKDEMKEFKDEMRQFKDEAEKDRREMNKKWGEMAKKMGTMVEDLVAPSLPRIIREEFGLEIDFMGIRIKKRVDGRRKEYDAIAVAGDYIYINSTKSTLESSDIRDIVKDIGNLREYFPEYAEKKIIGVVASLYIDESLVKYAERSGLIVLAIGDNLMEIKNSKGFKPKEW